MSKFARAGKRILAQQPNGNRSLSAGPDTPPEPGWEADLVQELDLSSLDPGQMEPFGVADHAWRECAGCAALTVRVAALEAEMATALGSLRQHGEMLADLNERLAGS